MQIDYKDINGVEIFRTGIWKDETYTEEDLDNIINASKLVGFTPPIKQGHSPDVGAPALGWCENLRRVGTRLVCDFKDVPTIIYDAIKNRLYNAVSSEIYFNFKQQDGTILPKALKAVALLGSEIPAVKSLKSLRELLCSDDTNAQEIVMYDSELLVEEFKELSSAQINDLPDAAFAVIKTGGKKDESGKTIPRSLRMLPHHTSSVTQGSDNDTVDLAHLRNALARISQADLTPEQLSKAKSHLEAHAKALKVGNYTEIQEFASKGIQFVIGKLKGATSTTVQTILFDKTMWTIDKAKAWLESHNMHSGKVDEGDTHLRFRQKNPDDFEKGSFRTMEPGVQHSSIEDSYQSYQELITKEELEMEVNDKIKELEEKLAKVIGFKDDEIKGLQEKITTITEAKTFSDTETGKEVSELKKQLEDTKSQLNTTVQKFAEAEKKSAELEEASRKADVSKRTNALKIPALRPYVEVFYDNVTKSKEAEVIKFSADGKSSTDMKFIDVMDGFVAALNRLADTELFAEFSTNTEFRREEGLSTEDPGVELDKRIREYCAKNSLDVIKNYDVALKAVLASDDVLKEAYASR